MSCSDALENASRMVPSAALMRRLVPQCDELRSGTRLITWRWTKAATVKPLGFLPDRRVGAHFDTSTTFWFNQRLHRATWQFTGTVGSVIFSKAL